MLIQTPEPTREERLAQFARSFLGASNNTYDYFRNQIVGLYNQFWHSEFTPQEIADILGPSALQLFLWHGKAQEFLKSIDENYEIFSIPEGFTVTPKEDGSISITN